MAPRGEFRGTKWPPPYSRIPSFEAWRRAFVGLCLDRRVLGPESRVLDMGCGVGGVASELTDILTGDGRYTGFDVDPRAIEDCSRKFEAYQAFRFRHLDVWNRKYNPDGIHRPDEYDFPVESSSYDLVLMRSVFTHMLPSDVTAYLLQAARALAPGGAAVITYLLYDDAVLKRIAGQERFHLRHELRSGICRVDDPHTPEELVGYEIEWVRNLYRKAGLLIEEPIARGLWSGGGGPDSQDVVVARKAL